MVRLCDAKRYSTYQYSLGQEPFCLALPELRKLPTESTQQLPLFPLRWALAALGLAEQQLALLSRQSCASLIAQVVYADEKLPHHRNDEITAFWRECEFLRRIGIDCAD